MLLTSQMRKIAAILAGIALAAACEGESGYPFEALYEQVPFDMPRVELPSIPSREVTLSDFGGVGDGVTLNTEAFRKAIASLAEQGGGRLVVPEGIWRTGPIGLESHIELYVSKNAVIVFDPDQDLYPIIDTNFEGLDVRRCLSPLYATGAHTASPSSLYNIQTISSILRICGVRGMDLSNSC